MNRQSSEGDDFDFICFITVDFDIIIVIDTQKVEARRMRTIFYNLLLETQEQLIAV